jgi:DNA polymerase III subunit epsilon
VSRRLGEVDGKHYTEHVDTVRDLERAGQLAEAEALLWRLVHAVEAEARAHRRTPAPWYFERLAIDFRKQKRYADEIAVIERYLTQVPGDTDFTVRLSKARQLLSKQLGTSAEESAEVAAAIEPAQAEISEPPRIEAPIGMAAFVDVETTGLSRASDEVVEFAIVSFWFRWDNGQVVQVADRYVGLREPSIPIPAAASRVHGLYMKHVKGKVLDRARILKIVAAADLLIAHNASFDYAFVTRLFPEAAQKPWFCSMNGVNWRAKGYESKGLQQLLSAHRISPGSAHRAGSDVEAAIKLLSTTNRAGISYLRELLASTSLQGQTFGPSGKLVTAEVLHWREISDKPAPPAAKRAGCFTTALYVLGSLIALLWLVI